MNKFFEKKKICDRRRRYCYFIVLVYFQISLLFLFLSFLLNFLFSFFRRSFLNFFTPLAQNFVVFLTGFLKFLFEFFEVLFIGKFGA